MKIKKDKLLEALETVLPGLAKKEIVDQLTHFAFSGSDIITYNDKICILYPLETEFVCSVRAEDFYKVIKAMEAPELEITHDEGKLKISGGRTKASIKTQKGGDIFDAVEDLGVYEIRKMHFLPDDFIEALRLNLFSASKDMTDIKFTGIFVDKDCVVSTDNLRVSQYILSESIETIFLIPASAAEELVKLPVVEFLHKNGWAFFRTKDEILFCSRLLDHGEYPDLQDLLDFDGVKLELPEKLEDVISTALIMSEGETDAERLIEIEVNAKSIRCRGENDRGWIENELDHSLVLKTPLQFEINPTFLLMIMKHTRKMVYTEGRARFEAKNFQHAMSIKG